MIRKYAQKRAISTLLTMWLMKHIATGNAAKLRGDDEAELMQVFLEALPMDLRHRSYAPMMHEPGFFGSFG